MRALLPCSFGPLCLFIASLGASCGFNATPRSSASEPNARAEQTPTQMPQSGGNINTPVAETESDSETAPMVDEPNKTQQASVACPVEITVDNRTTGQQKTSLEAAYPDLGATLEKAIQTNCGTLFAKQQHVPAGRKPVKLIVVSNSDTIAYASVGETSGSITISATFFLERADQNDTFDAVGALHHEAAHLYQQNRSGFPGWAIEGMADFVRYRSGYVKKSQRRRGGNYDDAYNTTAFFFDYLEVQHPGIMQRMLAAMGERSTLYAPSWFVREAGAPLEELWAAYQTSL